MKTNTKHTDCGCPHGVACRALSTASPMPDLGPKLFSRASLEGFCELKIAEDWVIREDGTPFCAAGIVDAFAVWLNEANLSMLPCAYTWAAWHGAWKMSSGQK